MITVQLKRQHRSVSSPAVYGTMTLPLESGTQEVSTLENANFIIPAGTYPLRLTYSPRFKKLMPLVDEVPDREGIRIHMGTKPEHSQGCILVDALALANIKVLFNQRKKFYDEEELSLQITEDYGS